MPDDSLLSKATTWGVVVRSADGTFKVWKDGQWQLLNVPKELLNQNPTPGNVPILQPSQPTFPKNGAALYFSATEEEEARRLAQRIDTNLTHKRYSLNKILSQVRSRLDTTLSGDLEERLRQAVLTFLRGTRHAIDFGALLMRPAADGGLGLSAEETQGLVMVLSAIAEKIHKEGGEVVDDNSIKGVAATVSTAPVAKEQSLTPPPPPPAVASPVVKPATKPPVTPITSKPVISALPKPPIVPTVTPPPPPTLKPLPPKLQTIRPPVVSTTRPKVDEVKTKIARRLTGPIEELRLLDIATFRTLGATPAEQAEQVVAKINALSKESLAKQAEGLAAWRSSEVYQIYQEIGVASIQSGQSVAQVAANRFRSGLPTLTEAEFNAIADGNKKLRY